MNPHVGWTIANPATVSINTPPGCGARHYLVAMPGAIHGNRCNTAMSIRDSRTRDQIST